MAERRITLKYATTCRRCGQPLPVGATARWNPDTRWTACVRCPDQVATSAAASTPRAASPAAGAARPAGRVSPAATALPVPVDPRWDELVRYQLACVQRAGLAPPGKLADTDAWTIVPLDEEGLVVGAADVLPVDGALRQLIADAKPQESVYYGWPTVIATDRRGYRRVAPLVVTELEPPAPGEVVAMAGDDDPQLNPALLTEDFFPPEALAVVHDLTADGLAFGDPVGMTAQVTAVLDALGFPQPGMDSEHLMRGPTPREPGAYNLAVAYRGASNAATRALVDELTVLRQRTDWQRTAARFLLEEAPARQVPEEPAPAAPLTLNDSQERALSATAALPVAVLTGPPGTGKSQLVAATVGAAWLRGETVLVASTNNTAVEVLAERTRDIDQGLLIRTGNAEYREALPPILEGLASRPVTPGVSAAVGQRQLEIAVAERAALHDRLAERAALEGELAQLVLDLEARRTLLCGAPEPSPVHEWRVQLGRRARRAHRTWWFPKSRARRALAAAQIEPHRAVTVADVAMWAEAELRRDELQGKLSALGPRDPDAERAALASADRAWAHASLRAVRQTVAAGIAGAAPALRQLAQLRRGNRAARATATAATLPSAAGWACAALSAASNFPLTAGLFDLVVVDEASQCGVAEVLPLAYRAKRLVVVGDPNQLTPVVTLPPRDLAAIAVSVGTTQDSLHERALSYGQDSAFTAFAKRAGTKPFLLDEHYRCHPDIAAFFNDAFYGGDLRVLTDVTRQSGDARGLRWLPVRGRTEPARPSGAVNRDEADAVVRWVLDRPAEPGSIGVVTPFAAQARLIEDRLRRALGDEQWVARDVTVGTAHRFQGGERDVVLFSLVLAAGARPGSAKWVEQQRNLVNVAVSRARRALVVVGDDAALATLPVPTLAALSDAARFGRRSDAEARFDDRRLHSEAEQRLHAALVAAGMTVELKPVVDGYELDFAVTTSGGRRLDIECDGIQHQDARGRQRRQDLTRDLVLQRLGWQVVRFPAWQCLAEPDRLAGVVADLLAR